MEYTREQLQQIVGQYPNIGTISTHARFTSGTDNANFYIESSAGKFVVKIYDGMNLVPDNILLELEVMKHSFDSGVKTPNVINTSDGNLYSKLGDKYAMMMEFVDAQNMKKQSVADYIIYEAGVEVGKMDIALSVFKNENRTRQGYIFDLKNFLDNEKSISLLSSEYSQGIFKKIIEEYKEKKDVLWSLPKGIIHNDITLHNLLVKDDKLKVIIDFSDIAYNPYIQNLAVAMSQLIFTYNWQPHQAGLFIKGYSEQRPLSEQEVELLYLVTLARYTTLVVEFNRWIAEGNTDPMVGELAHDSYKFIQNFIKF